MTGHDIEFRIGGWELLRALASPVRFAVFVDEQGIDPAIEIDHFDPVSIHCVALSGARPIGASRLLPDGHIGRMAVLADYRRLQIGGGMLERLVAAGIERGDCVLRLNAQAYVEAFYLRHGFVREGEPFMLEGIEHVSMWRAGMPSR